MKMIRQENRCVNWNLVAPLGSAQDIEDDLVQGRARFEEHSALEGAHGDLHQRVGRDIAG
jgi:hypothetical protein